MRVLNFCALGSFAILSASSIAETVVELGVSVVIVNGIPPTRKL